MVKNNNKNISDLTDKPHLICIQEIWFKPQLDFIIQVFTAIRNHSNKIQGGGVPTFLQDFWERIMKKCIILTDFDNTKHLCVMTQTIQLRILVLQGIPHSLNVHFTHMTPVMSAYLQLVRRNVKLLLGSGKLKLLVEIIVKNILILSREIHQNNLEKLTSSQRRDVLLCRMSFPCIVVESDHIIYVTCP